MPLDQCFGYAGSQGCPSNLGAYWSGNAPIGHALSRPIPSRAALSRFPARSRHGRQAWRHLFKTCVRRAGIEASLRDAICGHALRSTAESYEHVTVEDMADAILTFPRHTIPEAAVSPV